MRQLSSLVHKPVYHHEASPELTYRKDTQSCTQKQSCAFPSFHQDSGIGTTGRYIGGGAVNLPLRLILSEFLQRRLRLSIM